MGAKSRSAERANPIILCCRVIRTSVQHHLHTVRCCRTTKVHAVAKAKRDSSLKRRAMENRTSTPSRARQKAAGRPRTRDCAQNDTGERRWGRRGIHRSNSERWKTVLRLHSELRACGQDVGCSVPAQSRKMGRQSGGLVWKSRRAISSRARLRMALLQASRVMTNGRLEGG